MSLKILDVRVDKVDLSEVLEKVKVSIERDEKIHICTTNNEFILEAQQNDRFKKIINSCDLSVPDSTGVIWAAKFLKAEKINRITGVDLFEDICKVAADNEYRIFLLGGKKGIAKKTKNSLQKKYKGIHVVGYIDGVEIDPNKRNLDIVSEINESKAQILAVALGAPKQELWINNNIKLLNSKVYIGVGGTFDYISNSVPRAPLWMRKIGLEWLYRLATQPKRVIRIYKALVIFPIKIFIEKLK